MRTPYRLACPPSNSAPIDHAAGQHLRPTCKALIQRGPCQMLQDCKYFGCEAGAARPFDAMIRPDVDDLVLSVPLAVLVRRFRVVDVVTRIEGFFARMLACEGDVVARMEVASS
jgi:hypothetical protein